MTRFWLLAAVTVACSNGDAFSLGALAVDAAGEEGAPGSSGSSGTDAGVDVLVDAAVEVLPDVNDLPDVVSDTVLEATPEASPDSPPPPWHVVGRSCAVDGDCTELLGGYCRLGVCSAVCVEHTDCSCPAGTTDTDIGNGACVAACKDIQVKQTLEEQRVCLRVCSALGCEAAGVCTQAPPYPVCVDDQEVLK